MSLPQSLEDLEVQGRVLRREALWGAGGGGAVGFAPPSGFPLGNLPVSPIPYEHKDDFSPHKYIFSL